MELKELEFQDRCETHFYTCPHCTNLLELIHNAGAPLVCCGEEMLHLVPNTVEASQEKHLPVVTVVGDSLRVEIGSAPHPMLDAHYICWVFLQTEAGIQRKWLAPGDPPQVTFALGNDKPLAVSAYCNLHGLWQTEVRD